jgi:hypothetical protein
VTGLFTGQAYKLKVQAVNAIGSSQYSEESESITAAIVPDAPGQPNYLTSTKTQVAFTWTAPTYNGGSSLTGYKIAWCEQVDIGGDFTEFVDLVEINNPQTLQYYLTSGITTGVKYRFRVMAKNVIGYGTPSSHIEMMPATTPGSPE